MWKTDKNVRNVFHVFDNIREDLPVPEKTACLPGTEDVAGIQRADMLGRVAERCVKLKLKHQRDKHGYRTEDVAGIHKSRLKHLLVSKAFYSVEEFMLRIQRTDMLGRVAERCVKLELKHQRDKVPATNRFNSDSIAWLRNGRCCRNPEDRHAGPRSRPMREVGT
ncbi:hypothetical protein J6590_042783 [Homalodisca vitripennis]|nr:hypothetical protein J6590_042783 [Homalodisca vitripennis]